MTTGVPGLDVVLGGGLPIGHCTIVAGPPGAGKTLMAQRMAFHLADQGRRTLFLTVLSETHDKLFRHAEGFPWFDASHVGREIEFLSLYPTIREGGADAVLELIVRKIREHRASLLVLDAFR